MKSKILVSILIVLVLSSFMQNISSDTRFRVQLSDPTLVGDPTGLGSFTSTTQTTTNLVAGDSIRTLGSSSDMWGLSYTSTQLSNLWVMITILCSTTNDDIRLDHFTVTVTYTLNAPDTPVLSEVSHTTTSVATSWTIPNNGGSIITSYTLERSTNNFGSTDQSFVIPNLFVDLSKVYDVIIEPPLFGIVQL